VVLLALPVVAWIAHVRFGVDGVLAALVAAGVCWSAATLALVSAGLLRGPNAALYSMLFGMFFRLGLPLFAGVLLTRQGGPLSRAGLFGWLVVFYLLTLVAETVLSLRVLASPKLASPKTTGSG